MHLAEFKRHITANYGIDEGEFERLHEEFLAYFGLTVEEYVRQRHGELQKAGKRNPEIYRLIKSEAAERRFGAGELSERMIRRLIYG